MPLQRAGGGVGCLAAKRPPKEPLFISLAEWTYSGFAQLTDAQNDASNLVSSQAAGPRV
jgi:hypothetical protein